MIRHFRHHSTKTPRSEKYESRISITDFDHLSALECDLRISLGGYLSNFATILSSCLQYAISVIKGHYSKLHLIYHANCSASEHPTISSLNPGHYGLNNSRSVLRKCDATTSKTPRRPESDRCRTGSLRWNLGTHCSVPRLRRAVYGKPRLENLIPAPGKEMEANKMIPSRPELELPCRDSVGQIWG